MPTQGQREMAMLSPIRRSRSSALPAQQANGVPSAGGMPASKRRWSPVVSSMAARTSARRGVVVWDDLDAVEQTLLAVAAREHTLDHACGSWAAQPLRRSDVEMTMQAAGRLLSLGFIGFYRVQDGYPDLCGQDLQLVFCDQSHWQCGQENAGRVGLYLTTAGEDLVLGP